MELLRQSMENLEIAPHESLEERKRLRQQEQEQKRREAVCIELEIFSRFTHTNLTAVISSLSDGG